MPSGCKLLVSDNFFHFENAQVEKLCEFDKGPFINYVVSFGRGGGALCLQMDFMRTFEANTKCNNMNININPVIMGVMIIN